MCTSCTDGSKFMCTQYSKRTVPRGFSPKVFSSNIFSCPNRHVLKRYWFFSNVCVHIQIFWCFTDVNGTSEANGFILVRWFFWLLNGCYWQVISADIFFTDCSFNGPGKLSKVLMVLQCYQRHWQFMHSQCQWHRQYLEYWYQWHWWSCWSLLGGVDNACINSLIDTGEVRSDTELIW
jgi:hypothetical protein